MRIKAEQLSQQLQKKLAPLYAIFGNESLLVIEATNLIRKHARQQGFGEREIFSVDNHFRWSDILNASRNQSLFSDRKIIDIRIPSGKPGRDGSKAIAFFCQALPQDTVTLITLPRLDKQSQSSQWFKAIENAGITVQIHPIERKQLPAWIKHRLSMQQQTINNDTLFFIADKVEGNLLAAHQEIQKLALLYPQGHLEFDQVKNAILNVARYDIYQLTEAIMADDPARFAHILTGLQGEGTAPPLILAVLAEHIRQLIQLRKGLDQGLTPDQLFKSARIWGDRKNTMMASARRIPFSLLHQYLLHAAEIDRINKGVAKGKSTDPWNELLKLGLNMTITAESSVTRIPRQE
ncbi:MAG: DNA polymerase III subunit delta [Burkholderiales bacterium]|nr:DNA polymerase III subunit delta [Nitrosomonas sp.]MCP5274484.1 DNA polymerase III subunit delta [Burkholderiales bacterium]